MSKLEEHGYSRHGWLLRGGAGLRYRLGVASRALASIAGGYLLSAGAATAMAIYLPTNRAEAAITGMLASFVIYTCAVLWVFAARSAARAWAGLLLPATPLAALLLLHFYARGGA